MPRKQIKPIVLGENRIKIQRVINPDDTVSVKLYRVPNAIDTRCYEFNEKDLVAIFLVLPTANKFVSEELSKAIDTVQAIAKTKEELTGLRNTNS